MAGRGRSPGFVMTAEHRAKIANSNILSTLIAHAEGKRDMSATQVTAALGLLKKVMPDINATAFTDTEGNDLPASLTVQVVRPPSS